MPVAFWKVVMSEYRTIAWIVPNDETAKRNRLDYYIVTINEIERQAEVRFIIESGGRESKTSKPSKSWPNKGKCWEAVTGRANERKD